MKYDNDVISEFTPRMGNALTRGFGSALLKLMGWKIVGQMPKEKKLIFIGAPHTSNWDLLIALGAILGVGVKCSWMMKKEAFFWPLGGLWKSMGGVPIDRASKNDITVQMSEWFDNNEKAWLGLTPEGTRSKVKRFKKGYLRIAYKSGIPICVIALNGPTKEIIIDRVWELTGNIDVDNQNIKAHYDKLYKGVRLENS